MSITSYELPALVGQDLYLHRLASVEQLKADYGDVIPPNAKRRVREQLGTPARTFDRWLQLGVPVPRTARITIDAQVLTNAFAACNGSVWEMYQTLAEWAPADFTPSYETLNRRVNELVPKPTRELIRGGYAAMKKAVLYLSNPDRVSYRNELWQMDMGRLPFPVVKERGRGTGTFAWIVGITDYRSRAIFPPRLVVGKDPDRGDVLLALAEAMHHDPARGPFCGIPEFLKPDNGLQLTAKDIQATCHELGIELVPTAPWAPHQKGLIERHMRTLKDKLALIVGEGSRGPRDKTGRLYDSALPPIAEKLVNEALLDVIDAYNDPATRDRTTRDGTSPIEIWHADATPIRMPTPQQHRRLFKAEDKRQVRPGSMGIEFKNGLYLHDKLLGLVGEEVEVRFLPSDLRTIEVFRKRTGQWVCTAVRQDMATDEQRQQFAQERGRQMRAAENVAKNRARRRRANATVESTPERPQPPRPDKANTDAFHGDSVQLLDSLAAGEVAA